MTTRPQEAQLATFRARGHDLREAALVAARAFHDDPFFEFLAPNPVIRARGLALFWRSTIAAAGPNATHTAARRDGRMVGVSVVVPPGGWPLPALSQARQMGGALRAMVLRPKALVLGARYLLAIEMAHGKEEQWYLQLLAVDPSAQRAGIGGRLQEDMLRRADGDGLDCYLETQKRDNIAYYGRFGYHLERELKPVASGPPLFLMRRPPRG
jgi:GNAT superfamily N-acetyltransferase